MSKYLGLIWSLTLPNQRPNLETFGHSAGPDETGAVKSSHLDLHCSW